MTLPSSQGNALNGEDCFKWIANQWAIEDGLPGLQLEVGITIK